MRRQLVIAGLAALMATAPAFAAPGGNGNGNGPGGNGGTFPGGGATGGTFPGGGATGGLFPGGGGNGGSVSAVEPSVPILIGVGLLGAALLRRRR